MFVFRRANALLKEYPFGLLLFSLLLIIIGAPLTAKTGGDVISVSAAATLSPLVLLLTIAAAYAIWPSAKYRASAIILGGIVLAFLYLSIVFHHHVLTASHLVGQILFLVYVIAVVTRVVFRAPIVDGNILCGAACIYLLIGVMAGFLYSLIDFYIPHSFGIFPPGSNQPNFTIHANTGWLIYFSFTTLTTVGFGDVLPASQMARSLAVLEAVVGQILLVVMMARLVGLHVAQVSSGRHTNKPVQFETEEHHHHKK